MSELHLLEKIKTNLFLSSENLDFEQTYLKNLNVEINEVAYFPFEFDSQITIVGNGEIDTSLGNQINESCTVARFNRYKTKSFETFVGTKTSIHIINLQNLSLVNNDEHIDLLIDTSFPAKTYDFFKDNSKQFLNLRVIRPSIYLYLNRLLEKRYKTQGFFFVEIARIFFKKISICGFVGNTHYFNKKHKMYTAHPLEAEHEKYQQWQSESFNILS
jgi:hypothetical protein